MGQISSKLIFPVPERHEIQPNMKDVKMIQTKGDMKIPIIHIKYKKPDKTPYTIIYSHANGEDVFQLRGLLQHLTRHTRCDVVAYEYIGYSLSRKADGSEGVCSGNPSEQGCYDSQDAALKYVRDQGVADKCIVLMGRSLGTGPAVYAASRNPHIGGLIVLSPMLSVLTAVMPHSMAKKMKSLDSFASYDLMPKVHVPTFVVHGQLDDVVPTGHAKILINLLPPQVPRLPPCIIHGRGHHDIPMKAVSKQILAFLSFIGDAPGQTWPATVLIDHGETSKAAGPSTHRLPWKKWSPSLRSSSSGYSTEDGEDIHSDSDKDHIHNHSQPHGAIHSLRVPNTDEESSVELTRVHVHEDDHQQGEPEGGTSRGDAGRLNREADGGTVEQRHRLAADVGMIDNFDALLQRKT